MQLMLDPSGINNPIQEMKKENLSLVIAGVAGAALGYFIGKNFGEDINSKVEELSSNSENLKKNVSDIAENSSEILDDLKNKAVDLIGELDGKLSLVNELLKRNEK